MRVLVVGGGGREHALAWALARSPSVTEVHAAPGNPGIARVATCHPVSTGDLPGLAGLAAHLNADLVVIGPEAPLAAGLADALQERGIAAFGPKKAGARLEASKTFAKQIMEFAGIPTADARTFESAPDAIAYVEDRGGPVVVKADGLAAGKGVTVCDGPDDARAAILDAMEQRRFGDAGTTVLIEERMEGPELSILAFCDGVTVLPLPAAQDFKRALDGDRGPNTGGMGSYSPVPVATDAVLEEAMERILDPVAAQLAQLGRHYVGVIYAGLMLTPAGLKVVEFNCRFGDPETQAILPRLESDLGELMSATTQGSLAGMKVVCSEQACVSVVAASGGYPEADPLVTGFEITGIDKAESLGVQVFHSGTAERDGSLVTAGGRVLSVSALGDHLSPARELAYRALGEIGFEGMRFRTDIAERAAGHQ
ncbi:MAG TPA: phosphoribosylamine--glycine ligase [Actinomycetota bacterium]|nr:phosphoribosylamine--glycine ligase [Actinomycetota bacterium]